MKITLGEMRATGVRDLLVFCQDYRCSHNVKLLPDQVDRWLDEIRHSELEPRFIDFSSTLEPVSDRNLSDSGQSIEGNYPAQR
jgi:hypothetical protein